MASLTRLQRPGAAANARRISSSDTCAPSAISWMPTPSVASAVPASPGARPPIGAIALNRCVTALAPAANARAASSELALLCPSETTMLTADADLDQLQRAGQLGCERDHADRTGREQEVEQRHGGRAQVLHGMCAGALRREERPFEMDADDRRAARPAFVERRDPSQRSQHVIDVARDERRQVGEHPVAEECVAQLHERVGLCRENVDPRIAVHLGIDEARDRGTRCPVRRARPRSPRLPTTATSPRTSTPSTNAAATPRRLLSRATAGTSGLLEGMADTAQPSRSNRRGTRVHRERPRTQTTEWLGQRRVHALH